MKPPKLILLVKEPFLEEAHRLFDSTGEHMVIGGVRYFGSSIGELAFRSHYASSKFCEFAGEVDVLAHIARSEPHPAYYAVTPGLRGRWNYIFRTIPIAQEEVRPLREASMSREGFTEDELLLLELL